MVNGIANGTPWSPGGKAKATTNAHAVRVTNIPPKQPDRLLEVARGFEAVFVEMLLKQARESAHALGGESQGTASAVYDGWQDQVLSGAISAGGGIGLAEVLYRQLQQRGQGTPGE